MRPAQVRAYLERTDKWYLGSAGAVLWAPPFPSYLDRPGFLDPAHYFRYPIQPVFGLAMLDTAGREIPISSSRRRWRPGELVQDYRGPEGLSVTETRVVTPDDCLVSELAMHNRSGTPVEVRLVAWTSQPSSAVSEAETAEQACFRIHLQEPFRGPELPVWLALGVAGRSPAAAVTLAERGSALESWRLSPAAQRLARGHGLAPTSLRPPPGHEVHLAAIGRVVLPSGGRATGLAAAAVAPDRATSLSRLRATLRQGGAVEATRSHWERFFAQAPNFTCSDPYLQKAYWYRWYGLHLLTTQQPAFNYPAPTVSEGIDYFRSPISYSAQCHMREVRWLPSPELAQGVFRTFAHHQRADGSLPGLVPPVGERPEAFYHADWGSAVRAVHEVHPDARFLRQASSTLSRYADYLDGFRDPERSGLYDVWNHYETGQEFASRYLFADPQADRQDWGRIFRLKGVDATVYAYRLKRALEAISAELAPVGAGLQPAPATQPGPRNADHGTRNWSNEADAIARVLREKMWDPRQNFFVDVLPGSFERSTSVAAVGFYPFLCDLGGPEHLLAIHEHLLAADRFWTPCPVPSTSADDPSFSGEGEWRGVRRNCPWNGRVWPMTNSHVADALANAAWKLDRDLLPRAAELLHKYVRMLFFDQDPNRPNCFEHYNPLTGEPSTYRGIDDYQHSWLVDLIIRHVAGIDAAGEELRLRPLPMQLEAFELSGLPWCGREVRVEWDAAAGLRLKVDGRVRYEGRALEAVEL